MARGDQRIFGGRISAGDLVGMPDLLRNETGDYVPGDIKSGRLKVAGGSSRYIIGQNPSRKDQVPEGLAGFPLGRIYNMSNVRWNIKISTFLHTLSILGLLLATVVHAADYVPSGGNDWIKHAPAQEGLDRRSWTRRLILRSQTRPSSRRTSPKLSMFAICELSFR